MLVELGIVEQRYAAVCEVINDGQTVSDVARRFGVTRQTVHRWLRRYAAGGFRGLVDGSPKPDTCPHRDCQVNGVTVWRCCHSIMGVG